MKLQKLNSYGFSHIIIILLVVVGIGIAGAYYQVASHAGSKKTDRQIYATKVLKQANDGHINFIGTGFAGTDRRDRTSPRENLRSEMRGEESRTTRKCADRDGERGPYETVHVDLRILKFMYALSKKIDYRVTSIVGQCHESKYSQHYLGNAVDIACPFKHDQIVAANDVGDRFNISHNGEKCSGAGGKDGHYHYSLNGE